jgi:hypothetical protein
MSFRFLDACPFASPFRPYCNTGALQKPWSKTMHVLSLSKTMHVLSLSLSLSILQKPWSKTMHVLSLSSLSFCFRFLVAEFDVISLSELPVFVKGNAAVL